MFKVTQEAASNQPTEIVVHYNEDPPGSGKSEFYKRLIVEAPGRYLLAVPTQNLLDEHAHGRDGLRARLAAAGLPPAVEVVCISSPEPFLAISLSYEEFPQLTDDEVRASLEWAARQRPPAGAPA